MRSLSFGITCLALLFSSVSVASADLIEITNVPNSSNFYFESATPNASTSVFMIGIYESRTDHGFRFHPTGNATVDVGDQFGKIRF